MIKMKILLAGLSIALTLGCGHSNITAPPLSPSPQHPSPTPVSIEERQASAEELDPRLAQSSNQLGLRLHEQLMRDQDGRNVFISPLSISLAIAMAYNGSEGETKKEIEEALGWEQWDVQKLNAENERIQGLLTHPGKGIEVNIGNSLWTREGTQLKDDFTQRVKKFYQAELTELDFTQASAVDRINAWVDQQTKGKISKIVDHPIQDEVMMYLINAIYFKGEWTKPFSANATQKAAFHLANGNTKDVDMMSNGSSYQYMKHDTYEAIRLPYGEGQMNMLIILPAKDRSLAQLHEQIWEKPSTFQQPFPESMGIVKLPRFQLQFEETINSSLKALGMNKAFEPGLADFSSLAERELYISSVRHKSILEVNEKGSEAAAVTSIEASITSAPMYQFEMNIDRPFFLAIEDQQTGAWLFMGSVYDPGE